MLNINRTMLSLICTAAIAVSGTSAALGASAYSAPAAYVTSASALTTVAKPNLKTAYTANSSSVTLSRNKVSGATGYYVYQYKNGGWKSVKTVSSNSTSTTVTGLTPYTTYRFKLKAYKKSGSSTTISALSNETSPHSIHRKRAR